MEGKAIECPQCSLDKVCGVVIERLNPSGVWIMFGEYGSKEYDTRMWSLGFASSTIKGPMLICDGCAEIVLDQHPNSTYLGDYLIYASTPVHRQYNLLVDNKVHELAKKNDSASTTQLLTGSSMKHDPKKSELICERAFALIGDREAHTITSEEAFKYWNE